MAQCKLGWLAFFLFIADLGFAGPSFSLLIHLSSLVSYLSKLLPFSFQSLLFQRCFVGLAYSIQYFLPSPIVERGGTFFFF